MIILNSDNTLGTETECICIVRTGVIEYVDIIIYDLYVRNIWKAAGIRIKGSMGSIEIIIDSGILPGDTDRNGICRIDSSGISDIDRDWNCITA